jgi:ArsR family transcriptional regulator
MASSGDLVTFMKAAGEPSRLRLLALCAQQDLAVTELARAVSQSGPRVSRHLKILCEAGLLERVRQGQWVHYRLARSGPAAEFLHALMPQLERDESLLVRDRQRVRLADSSAPLVQTSSRLGRNLAAFLRPEPNAPLASCALVIGIAHPELLAAAAAIASRCIALAPTRRAAAPAQAFIKERALPCELRIGAAVNLLQSERDCEAIVLECLATPGSALATLLRAARQTLSARGRVWLFVGYDSLQGAGEHPLARLRALLAIEGLECQQIKPIEADGTHVLAASARLSAAHTAATAADAHAG